MLFKIIASTFLFSILFLACSVTKFSSVENFKSGFGKIEKKQPSSYKEAIETFNINADYLNQIPKNDSLLLSSFQLILKNKIAEATMQLENANITDSYNLLNSFDLLLYSIYYPEQQWNKIKLIEDIDNKINYLKKLATFYDFFSNCTLTYPVNADSLNFPFKGNSHIFIDVSIQDKTYTFLFDTGATDCIISSKIAKTIDSSLVFKVPLLLSDNSNNPLTNATPALIKQMKIGDLTISNLPVLWAENIPSDFDGIIGWNFLKNHRFIIDYITNTITLHKNHKVNLKKANLFGNKLPFVNINLKNNDSYLSLLMLLDTGSDQTRFFSSDLISGIDAEKNVSKNRKSLLGKSTFSSKRIKSGVFNIYLNEQTIHFKNMLVTQEKMSSQYIYFNGLLGSDLFKKGVLEFDAKSNYIQFDYK
jgi:predicted aspartyl protease